MQYHTLRPRTGADILRNIDLGDPVDVATITQAARTTPGWAEALTANPTATFDQILTVATAQPTRWTLAHLLSHPQSGEKLDDILALDHEDSDAVWATAIWTHRDRLATIVDRIAARPVMIRADIVDLVADVAASDTTIGLDMDQIELLLHTARAHPALRVAAAYADRIDRDTLVAHVERYHARVAVASRSGAIGVLLHRRTDVLDELLARQGRYSVTARAALETQVVTHTYGVSADRRAEALRWAIKAPADHAYQLLREAAADPRYTAEQLQPIVTAHQSEWRTEYREIPKLDRRRNAVSVGPAQATTSAELTAWLGLADGRRIEICEELAANPHVSPDARHRCRNQVTRASKADPDRVRQLLRRERMPEALLETLGVSSFLRVAKRAPEKAPSAPQRLTVAHLLVDVRGYAPGCPKHRAACTAFAQMMGARHRGDAAAWQTALSLVDTFDSRQPVGDLVALLDTL
jgi:hypothetical protein